MSGHFFQLFRVFWYLIGIVAVIKGGIPIHYGQILLIADHKLARKRILWVGRKSLVARGSIGYFASNHHADGFCRRIGPIEVMGLRFGTASTNINRVRRTP